MTQSGKNKHLTKTTQLGLMVVIVAIAMLFFGFDEEMFVQQREHLLSMWWVYIPAIVAILGLAIAFVGRKAKF